LFFVLGGNVEAIGALLRPLQEGRPGVNVIKPFFVDDEEEKLAF
jgi:hypothetical protein